MSGEKERADEMPAATDGRQRQRVAICPTRTPEVHYLGEFPMTCYRCHIEADS